MLYETKIKTIADHYGKPAQAVILMEECAELVVAMSKVLRAEDAVLSNPTDTSVASLDRALQNLKSEMADVLIMIDQIIYLTDIPADDIYQVVNYKLDRQLRRIEEENI